MRDLRAGKKCTGGSGILSALRRLDITEKVQRK